MCLTFADWGKLHLKDSFKWVSFKKSQMSLTLANCDLTSCLVVIRGIYNKNTIKVGKQTILKKDSKRNSLFFLLFKMRLKQKMFFVPTPLSPPTKKKSKRQSVSKSSFKKNVFKMIHLWNNRSEAFLEPVHQ